MPISDKRVARTVVEDMRRELHLYGEETFKTEKLAFEQLLALYEKGELTEATFQFGIKVKGRRSISSVRSAIKPLREYFGKRRIRTIRPIDIKNYKDHRLDTPVEVEVNEKTTVFDKKTGKEKTEVKKVIRSHQRKIASVNRELELLRTMLNYAVQNEWLIKNPFALAKGIISKAAEVQRDRVLSNDEEQRLLEVCVDRKAHLKPLLICALDTAMRRGGDLQNAVEGRQPSQKRDIYPSDKHKDRSSQNGWSNAAFEGKTRDFVGSVLEKFEQNSVRNHKYDKNFIQISL